MIGSPLKEHNNMSSLLPETEGNNLSDQAENLITPIFNKTSAPSLFGLIHIENIESVESK